MFEASSDVGGCRRRTSSGGRQGVPGPPGKKICIAQIETVGQGPPRAPRGAARRDGQALGQGDYMLYALMVTDIGRQEHRAPGAGDAGPAERAFGVTAAEELLTAGVMSRKKQVAPGCWRALTPAAGPRSEGPAHRLLHQRDSSVRPFGAAAGTPLQGWYSFDLGAWHLIALNSLAPPALLSGQHRNAPDHGRPVAGLYAAGRRLILNGHDHDLRALGAADAERGRRPGRRHPRVRGRAPRQEPRQGRDAPAEQPVSNPDTFASHADAPRAERPPPCGEPRAAPHLLGAGGPASPPGTAGRRPGSPDRRGRPDRLPKASALRSPGPTTRAAPTAAQRSAL